MDVNVLEHLVTTLEQCRDKGKRFYEFGIFVICLLFFF